MNLESEIKQALETLRINNKKYKQLSYVPSYEEYQQAHNQQGNYYQTDKPQPRYKFTAKDVYNSVVLPTAMGSQQWQGFKAGNNARIITDLQWAGDRLLAKSTTSEFAVHEETGVINPWNPDYSCGTSSSGAAVNVLVDPVDYALATQTAGSIGRPASYVGVMGYKPSFGLLPRTGVLKTCDSFDSIGLFAKNIKIMRDVLLSAAKLGTNFPKNHIDRQLNAGSKTVGIIRHKDIDYSAHNHSKLDGLASQLEQMGWKVKDISVPANMAGIHENHRKIYSYSLGYYFSQELEDTTRVSQSLKEFIKFANDLSVDKFTQALKIHAAHLKQSDEWLAQTGCSFFINPTTHDTALKIGQSEQDDLNLLYTYLYMPSFYYPMWFNHDKGLPVGCTIASARGCDLSILDFADMLSLIFKPNEGKVYGH